METRSRTTKLIVKNVEMLESQKFDKFDKVVQWLDKLDKFEYQQQPNRTPSSEASSNVQNTTTNRVDKNNDDFFDSDSSVNTGKAHWLWWFNFFLPFGDIFIFLLAPLFYFSLFSQAARYILTNRKNKRKSQTQCRSKIKKYRESDVQFEYDFDDLDNSGHKLKRLKIDSNLKYCSVPVQKMNANEINFNGT